MGNINDDNREGYKDVSGAVARKCSQIASGTSVSGNANDLDRESNKLYWSENVKNILSI